MTFRRDHFFQILQALICRMVWVSCPSMRSRKSCLASKLWLMRTRTPENTNISTSGQLWACNGRICCQFPVLTHNYHLASRGPALKGARAAARRVKNVRQHRKLAKNAPVGPPNLAQIRDCSVFRDSDAHEADLDPPITFSRSHRRTRDPHHSIDQSL